MTLLVTIELLDEFFKSRLPNYPSKGTLKTVLGFIDKENYLQIYYDYGHKYNLILLEFFECYEDYVTCKVILDTIENINKTLGENLSTR